MDRSLWFLRLKWTLFGLTTITTMCCIITSAIAHNSSLIGLSIIVAVLSVFGLIATFQEHFWYILIYAVFMASNTLASIYLTTKIGGSYWWAVALTLTVTVLAFCYARAIRIGNQGEGGAYTVNAVN